MSYNSVKFFIPPPPPPPSFPYGTPRNSGAPSKEQGVSGRMARGCIQREKWGMGPYTGVDYNIALSHS